MFLKPGESNSFYIQVSCFLQILSFVDESDLFTAERDAAQGEETTNFVFNPNRSLNLAAQREKLPINRYKNEILYCLENFQTLGELTLLSKKYFNKLTSLKFS